MSTTTLTPLLSVKQVGEILGRHEKTVLGLAKKKRIACIRQNDGSVQFTEQQVRDYLASCEDPATETPAPKPDRDPKYAGR